MRGLDESRLARMIPERLTQLANRALEHIVADEHARPYGAQQFLFRDQPARLARQELQQGKRLRRERHDLLAAIQVAADRVEAEIAECQDAFGRHGSRNADLTESSPIVHRGRTISRRAAPYNHSDTFFRRTHICDSFHSARLPFVVAAAVLAPPVVGGAAAQTTASHKHHDDTKEIPAPAPGAPIAPRLQNLGVHTFPVSTKVARAQLFMNQGLNLTYGFNHAEAGRAFAEAARLDPSLAIAYWGQALVLGPNINAPMDAQAEPKALALIQKAIALKPKATAA